MTAVLKHSFSTATGLVQKAARRSKPKTGVSVTLRLTAAEKEVLQRDAGQLTLSSHIRTRLFGAKGKRGPDRLPSVDSKALARVLGILGQSNIAANLTALATAARSGTLENGPALLAVIERACADIRLMRAELLIALGVKPE